MKDNVTPIRGEDRCRYDLRRLKQWRGRIEDLTPATASEQGKQAAAEILVAIGILIASFEKNHAAKPGE